MNPITFHVCCEILYNDPEYMKQFSTDLQVKLYALRQQALFGINKTAQPSCFVWLFQGDLIHRKHDQWYVLVTHSLTHLLTYLRTHSCLLTHLLTCLFIRLKLGRTPRKTAMKKFLQILRDVDPQYYAAPVRILPERYYTLSRRLNTISTHSFPCSLMLTHSLTHSLTHAYSLTYSYLLFLQPKLLNTKHISDS